VHLWVVDVSRLNPAAVPLNRLPDSKAYEWMPLVAAAAWPGASDAESRNHCALIEYPEDPSVPLSPPRSVASLVAEERELVHRPEPLPPSVRPWREEYPDLPPPAPLPRLIRYSRGRWRAWVAVDQTLSKPRSFEWRPLPDALNSQLDLHLHPPTLACLLSLKRRVPRPPETPSSLRPLCRVRPLPSPPSPSMGSVSCGTAVPRTLLKVT
jgi:hypothetical protein